MTTDLNKYRKDIDSSVEAVKKRIQKEKQTRKYISSDSYTYSQVVAELESALPGEVKGKVSIKLPPSNVNGDLSFPVFDVAKELGADPVELASNVAEKLNATKGGYIDKASVIGPFVNLGMNKAKLYEEILSNVEDTGEKYGQGNQNKGKVAVVDYSSPNIAKPIGVQHLRSTIIGQALSNIYEATGYTVIKDNHLGDWGTQFGALALAYEMWGDEKKLEADPIGELNGLYVRFHKESEDDESLQEKAREYFVKIESGDTKLLGLWRKFHDISLKSFQATYKKLGISFDTFIGEAYFVDKTAPIVKECVEKGLAGDDPETGAIVAGVDNLPTFLLQKKDGSSLYITRDLATLIFRAEEFSPESMLYVVGNEQELSFRQLFALSQKMGYTKDMRVKHIGFGMILSGGKKMSTRRGTLIELGELINESIAKSREMLKGKNPELSDKELGEISEIIGMGAIFYNDLRQSRMKDISFDWNRMLDFHEGSAVYLQYTCVRVNSILRKLGDVPASAKNITFEKFSEFELAKKLMFYPEIVKEAQGKDSPHIIATYLEELAQSFNSFYMDVSIMKTPGSDLKASRIMLAKSVLNVLKNGLSILNIQVPEKM